MAIYRGPGGSGDAVNDSSSETRLAVEARDAALAAQSAAEAAQAAAETAETNAETAETNAETAETNAETAATNAASSASSASSSASAASTSATSAASSASSASTSATNAASSASSASTSASNASTSATNAASSASSASSSATSAASSASSASTSASTATTKASEASTSATNAASSASSASSSASTATTQAGIATTKASEASTSATNAASSASSASTSATNAASSASSASTSATNASNSATAASSAQSAAEAARDAALSAYDNFDDRYLGPKASDPTLDNDGNALIAGALYFNTATNVMKVYDGSAWVAAYVSAAGVLLSVNNLSDLNNTATARTNLGLGTAATTAATDYATAAQGAKADTALQPATIGVSVQGYDANTAKLNAAQSWSAAQSFNAGVTLGDASGDALTINSSAVSIPNGLNFDSNTFVIDATNNNVGIGTSSPYQAKLDVKGVGGTGSVANIGASNSNDDQLLIGSINRGSSPAFFSLPTGSAFVGAIGNGIANTLGVGTYGAAPLVFGTTNTERMRIDSSGNVGIGTSSPSSYANYTTVTQNGTSGVEYDFKIGGTLAGYVEVTSTLFKFDAESIRYFQWVSNGSEKMRLDSSGNLGIGTSSPLSKLNVYTATTGGNIRISSNTDSAYGELIFSSSNATYAAYGASISSFGDGGGVDSGNLMFNTGQGGVRATKMTLTGTGNLGLGVTPSGWTSYKAMQVGTFGSFADSTTGNIDLSANRYNASGDKYIGTGYASMLRQVDGAFKFFNAPSGTAGNAITFTQAMTLDASGNLGIGVTSMNYKAEVAGTTRSQVQSGATNNTAPTAFVVSNKTTGAHAAGLGSTIQFEYVNSGGGYAGGQISSVGGADPFTADLRFYPRNYGYTEAMRIDSSGNLLVGGTTATGTPTQGFQVLMNSGQTNIEVGHITGTGSGTEYAGFSYNGSKIGSITQSGTTAVLYNTSSDYRLKDITGSLTGYKERIMALQPKQGTWKADGSEFKGFIAHEFAEQYPNAVSGTKDAVDADGKPKYQGMQAGGSETIADLVAMIQELVAEVDSLKAQLNK